MTAGNLSDFYIGLGHPEGWEMRKDVQDLVRDLEPPGVRTYCIHGSKVPTTSK